MEFYTFEQIKPGLSAQFRVTLTPAMLEAFRVLSGDENPLHVDADYARRGGFEDRVAYGMLTAAFFSRLVGMHLPGERALLQGMELGFQAPVYAGQELVVKGEVSHVHEAFRRIEIKARIETPEGKRLVKALIKVGIRP